MRTVVLVGLAALAAACGNDSSADPGVTGLPPASQLTLPEAVPGQLGGSGASAGQGNSHEGTDLANPHAGMDLANPHAGMDLANPHAGAEGAPQMLPVDPAMFLKGTIAATAATKARAKPGAILFIGVKPINPVTGDVIGGTLAADRIELQALPVAFSLNGANVMRAGSVFEGDVLIEARIDQDGEATTKQPGDVTGSVVAKIPAQDLTLTLDTVIP